MNAPMIFEPNEFENITVPLSLPKEYQSVDNLLIDQKAVINKQE
jgi:hypothetical protein